MDNENPMVLTNTVSKTDTFFINDISTRKDTQLGKDGMEKHSVLTF